VNLAEAIATRLRLEQHRDAAEPPSVALALLRRIEAAARAALRSVPPRAPRPEAGKGKP
jgi:hypothetical protein